MAALILAATATWPCMAAEPALVDLSTRYQGENLVVSVQLVDGLTPERMEEIESGIETVFEYRIQVTRRRVGLPDEVFVRRKVECLVRRDALARQYTLTRRVDGELVERRVAAEADLMRAFLTRIDDLSLARRVDLPEGLELEVRARCDLGLQWRFYLIPWRMTTGWARAPVPAAPAVGGPEGEHGHGN